MNVSVLMIVLGVMMLLTPIILFFKDGGGDDADFISWLINKPIPYILTIHGNLVFGFFMVTAGISQTYWTFL